MRSHLLAAAAVATCALGACHRKPADPPWSYSFARHLGADTVEGAPLDVPRAAAVPHIDGKLDDAAWAGAAELTPFVEPLRGAVAAHVPLASVARMTWDDRALYLGIVVHDPKPESFFARDDVDPHIWGRSSGIELMLQPGDPGDNQDYYELQVDVAGAIFDTHYDDYNKPITGAGVNRVFGHQDWKSGIERAVYVQPGSFYSVEIALPWSSISGARVPVPPKPGDVWRLNLYAFRDGQRRALAWSPLLGKGNFHRSSRFGRVRFR